MSKLAEKAKALKTVLRKKSAVVASEGTTFERERIHRKGEALTSSLKRNEQICNNPKAIAATVT